MSKLLALVAITAVCFVGGCKSDDSGTSHGSMKSSGKSSTPTTMMSADACPHCAGMQTAKADGTCPICGRKAVR